MPVSYTYNFPRPALTVDCVVFGFDGNSLHLLLIRRGLDPYKSCWALPGGFVHMEESLEDAARRELHEEAGLQDVFLEQLYTFGQPERDPRGRVVSVAFTALVRPDRHPATADTDAEDAAWFDHRKALPELAFDHAEIVAIALQRLRSKVRYQPVGFELLPQRFTLTQLQSLYEAILGRALDRRNFRKKITAYDFIEPTDEFETGHHRPARLHRFNHRLYLASEKQGIHFEI